MRKDRESVTRKPDLAQLQEELVDAFEWCEEDRARALVAKLAEQPRQGRAVLEEMLRSKDASVRRAAVFGLGELGGKTSIKRLEQQMAIEEARDDYDGESVLEVITQALGRIKETGSRASLIRRLKRLLENKPSNSDVSDVAYALWRKRHPELIPVIRSALEQLPVKDAWALRALLYLLERPPNALAAWALDPSVPPGLKEDVMVILHEELPDELLPVMPAFISGANALPDSAVSQRGDAANFCERLFTNVLLHPERILAALSTESRSELRALARRCVEARLPNCSLRAAAALRHVGRPEDVALLEAYRPADPIVAVVYDDSIKALRAMT